HPPQPGGRLKPGVEDPGHVQAERDRQDERDAEDEEGQKPHDGNSLSPLEPLGAQQRRQQIPEQEQGHEGGQQEHDHGGSFQTRSQAATKVNFRPRVTRLRTNGSGIPMARATQVLSSKARYLLRKKTLRTVLPSEATSRRMIRACTGTSRYSQARPSSQT